MCIQLSMLQNFFNECVCAGPASVIEFSKCTSSILSSLLHSLWPFQIVQNRAVWSVHSEFTVASMFSVCGCSSPQHTLDGFCAQIVNFPHCARVCVELGSGISPLCGTACDFSPLCRAGQWHPCQDFPCCERRVNARPRSAPLVPPRSAPYPHVPLYHPPGPQVPLQEGLLPPMSAPCPHVHLDHPPYPLG